MEVRKIVPPNELYHFGTEGMRWGRRRYQNPDGSLTAAGRAHYGYGPARASSVETTNVVRKANNTGSDYASNSFGLQSYGNKRASSLNEKARHLKPKSTRDQDNQIYLQKDSEGGGLIKGKDIWSYEQQIAKTHSYAGTERYEDASAAYSTLKTKDSTYLNDGYIRNGKHYVGNKNGLEDASIDSLREAEVTAIGADYCGFLNNGSHTSSKLAARLSQDPTSSVKGHGGVSPYLNSKGSRKAESIRKDVDSMIAYKNSENYKKRHK